MNNTKPPEVIYMVWENSDSTEGRGPMRLVPNSGFFLSENDAWDFADTMCGVMGRTPDNGSWRHMSCPDIKVEAYYPHNGFYFRKKKELEDQMAALSEQLHQLKSQHKKHTGSKAY